LNIKRLLRRDDFTPKQPAQPTSIKVATHEWLVAKTLPERFDETTISPAICRFPIAITLSARYSCHASGISTPNSELKISSCKAPRKLPMFQHGPTKQHENSMKSFAVSMTSAPSELTCIYHPLWVPL
jgi:hypothetical protein